MKKRMVSIVIVGILVVGGFFGLFVVNDQVSAAGPTYVNGSITSDTTWFLADSPYIVTGDVTVEAGATLTIEPGVEVKFDGVYSIIIDGTLYAQGNSGNKITFTSNQTSPAKGDWYTIRLRTEGNIIDYAEVEYATYGVFMTFFGANNILSNTTINNCKYDGIYITNSNDNTISDCTITSNDRYGITIYESDNTEVNNCIIQYNNFFGILLNASTYTQINNCNISYNDGKGILLYSNSHHTSITDCELYDNNNKGIDLSGTSDNDIINTKVLANNGIGIDFGGETTDQWIENCDIMQNEGTGIDLRGSDHVDINGCNISKNKGDGGIYSGNGVAYINITNTEIWNNLAGNGIEFFGANWTNIIDSRLIANSGNGISYTNSENHHNNTIENCIICNNGNNGILFDAISQTRRAPISIQDNNVFLNEIYSNSQNGILFDTSFGSVYIQDNNIHSNNIFSNGQNGINFNCIDNIHIQDNYIYSNTIFSNIDNGIYFYAYGEYDDTSIIQYNSIYSNNVYSNNQNGIYLYAYDNAHIDYNFIYSNIIHSNFQNGLLFFSFGFEDIASIYDNNIYSNTIYSNLQNGIFLDTNYSGSHSFAVIASNRVYSNDISSNSKNGVYIRANSPETYIQDNHIYLNDIYGHDGNSGIFIIPENPATNWQSTYIFNNTLYSNLIGIRFIRIKSHNVYYNSISYNKNSGILIDSSTFNNFHHNNIFNNNWEGINLTSSSSDNNIKNNSITSNNKTGIFISSYSNNNLIYRNEISNNIDTGLKITDTTGNQVHHNNFIDNAQNAYDSTIALNNWDDGAEGNYWSDYAGFDDNGDGFGEDPYVIPGGGSRDWHPFMNPLNLGFNPPTFQTQLTAGWNLFSIPLDLVDTDISTVLSSISGNYDKVMWYNGNDNKWHSTDGDLTDIDNKMGLWIYMKKSDTLAVTGAPPNSTSIQLYEGWNLIGYPSLDTHTVDETFISIAGKYTTVWNYDLLDSNDHWKVDNENKPLDFNHLTDIKPGGGYWIYVEEDCVWEVNNFQG